MFGFYPISSNPIAATGASTTPSQNQVWVANEASSLVSTLTAINETAFSTQVILLTLLLAVVNESWTATEGNALVINQSLNESAFSAQAQIVQIQQTVNETSPATETQTLAATLLANDTLAASEAVLISQPISQNESAPSVEAQTIASALSVNETLSASESVSVDIILTASEVGIGAEASSVSVDLIRSSDIIVSGAGQTEDNGRYTHTGWRDGKRYYNLSGEFVNRQSIVWITTRWRIYGNVSGVAIDYHAFDNTTLPSEATDWQVSVGLPPVPSITGELRDSVSALDASLSVAEAWSGVDGTADINVNVSANDAWGSVETVSISSLPAPINESIDQIVVSGCGSPECNGIYDRHPVDFGGKAAYKIRGGLVFLYWDSGQGWWAFQEYGTTWRDYYWGPNDVATPDLVTTWVLSTSLDGIDPVPNLVTRSGAPSVDVAQTVAESGLGSEATDITIIGAPGDIQQNETWTGTEVSSLNISSLVNNPAPTTENVAIAWLLAVVNEASFTTQASPLQIQQTVNEPISGSEVIGIVEVLTAINEPSFITQSSTLQINSTVNETAFVTQASTVSIVQAVNETWVVTETTGLVVSGAINEPFSSTESTNINQIAEGSVSVNETAFSSQSQTLAISQTINESSLGTENVAITWILGAINQTAPTTSAVIVDATIAENGSALADPLPDFAAQVFNNQTLVGTAGQTIAAAAAINDNFIPNIAEAIFASMQYNEDATGFGMTSVIDSSLGNSEVWGSTEEVSIHEILAGHYNSGMFFGSFS